MYQVPHNPQNKLRWPIALIFFYYAIVGIGAAIGGCLLVASIVYGKQRVSLFWPFFFFLFNISRLGFAVGFVRFRAWGYRGIVLVEALSIMSLLGRFVLQRERISWVEIALSMMAMLILGYLLHPRIKHQFLQSNRV
ncbi:hypothetical protein [Herpetosiphon geysericola]|uniref:Uncharacterized protein n=1 Tax=Herpetosiphon geysericola TaxID=70996 RepID=A0A0P6XLK3_9CHLR|nr:hypothetical protein [Herpetosiphon geysericola]KPL81187.1 hypothetical protein SE18_21050 [Herpetosiphon geysericola]